MTRPLHVAISGNFWHQPDVGSGQYLHGLLQGLRQVAPDLKITLLLPQPDDQPPAAGLRDVIAIRPPRALRQRRNAAKLWFEQIGAPLAALRARADLLHVPYFAPPLAAPLPTVVSVLDLIPLLLPEYRGSRAVQSYMRLAATAAPRASALLTISHATSADLRQQLHIDPARITVTHLAAATSYRALDRANARAEIARRYDLTGPLVYYVGGLDARKNVGTLVSAFGMLRRAGGPPATLVIAGQPRGTDPLLFPDLDALIAEQQLPPQAIRRVTVPPDDGPLLYRAATVFAYPSRYEGFGLPPLEAMASGTPVVCANTSSLPEVVGDAALLLDPDDVSGWCTVLWRLLADANLRTGFARRGLARAAQFSYTRCATETLAVYQRVAGRDSQ